MTLSPTEIVHAWIREDLSAGAKMSIGFYAPKLIERLNAARSEAPPIEVEEVARIVQSEGRKLCREALLQLGDQREEDETCDAANYIAQAILSKLQGGEGNSSQSQPIVSEVDTRQASTSGGGESD